ncbi:MAG: caspase family protein [Actinomycetota bacterium]
MALKRREFLQKASWALAALGISEATLGQLGTREAIAASLPRYYGTLAQPTGRKLALLVGINQYPTQGGLQSTSLHGCITDVELQRELLIYRFGFQPSDILTLIDGQATRENIEAAFLSHLQEQAKDGDVVVFHFSGYGSHVSTSSSPEVLQNSLVPVDDWFPTQESPKVNDLLEETLWQMLRSLPTPHAIAVLDTSYTYPGTDLQGNLRLRSRARSTIGQPNSDEFPSIAQVQSQPNRTPPIALTAAAPSQLATETQWNGFSAGLFTYALTQTLWWTTPATQLQISFSRAAAAVEQLTGPLQQPQFICKEGKKIPPPPSPDFRTLKTSTLSADGAVTAVEDSGKTVQLWLAGLPPMILDTYGVNSLVTLVPSGTPASESSLKAQIRSRTGLLAKAQIKELGISEADPSLGTVAPATATTGQLVQEAIRVLPRNIGLTVAIDSRLERIERVDATSAFASIPQVSAVVGEQPADYRFSRVPETTIAQALNTPLPPLYQGRYGLFSLNQTLIPNTVGEGGEAVKMAVQRLTPHLRTLLAAKLLRLTANESSSLLKVKATLATIAPETKVLMQREPVRATSFSDRLSPFTTQTRDRTTNSHLLSLPVGTRIQYRLENLSDRPLYVMAFCLDSAGRVIAITSRSSQETSEDNTVVSEQQQVIPPGQSLNVPTISVPVATAIDAFGWMIHGPSGLVETQIIVSQTPFTQTLAALDGGVQPVRDTQALRVLLKPLKVAQAVLQDLHNASLAGVQKAGIATDDFALDVNAWATLSFVYRVV